MMKFKAEFRRFHYAFLHTFIPCAILTICVFALFCALLRLGITLPISYWFAALPANFRAFFYILGAVDMSDPLIFFARFFQPIYFAESIAICLIAGRSLNSDECALGELWFTLPVSRTNVFLRRFLGGLLLVFCINTALLVVTLICYCLIFIPALSYIAAYTVIFMRISFIESILFSIGVLYSALIRSSKRSALFSVMTLLIDWGIAIIPSFFGKSNFLMYIALPYYAIPEYSLHIGPHFSGIESFLMFIVLLIFGAVSLVIYRKKEFYIEG